MTSHMGEGVAIRSRSNADSKTESGTCPQVLGVECAMLMLGFDKTALEA